MSHLSHLSHLQHMSHICASHSTLTCNGANRLSLPPDRKFNLQLRGHIQHWCGVDFSSSSTLCSRPWRLLVLFTVVIVNLTGKVHYAQPTKKPLHIRGQLHWLFPSSCGMLRRNWHLSCGIAGGLPGFIGPFPSTSLDESRIFCAYLVVMVLLIC